MAKIIVPGACDAIMLDKINISSADAALSFYVYRHEGNANELRVYVISEGKKVLLETVKIDELTIVKDWNRVILPLANYNGKFYYSCLRRLVQQCSYGSSRLY